MPEAKYPGPLETPTNAPMLEAWRRGLLKLQKCLDCGYVVFYPRPLCPRCWSRNLDWIEGRGTGRIVSFSVVHRPLHPAFEAEIPIVMAEVEVPEGAAMISRVVGVDPAAVRSGAAVRLVAMPEAAAYPLPTFTPEPDG